MVYQGEDLDQDLFGEWEFAIDSVFIEKARIAVSAPEKGPFVYGGKNYFRANNGNVYRKVKD